MKYLIICFILFALADLGYGNESIENCDVKYLEVKGEAQGPRNLKDTFVSIVSVPEVFEDLYNKSKSETLRNKNICFGGTLLIEIVIDQSGKIINIAKLDSSLNNLDFETGILKKISKINFGKVDSSEISKVKLPIKFSPYNSH